MDRPLAQLVERASNVHPMCPRWFSVRPESLHTTFISDVTAALLKEKLLISLICWLISLCFFFFLRLWTMNPCLTRWYYRHIQKQNQPDWLSVAQTSKAGARKRLGHFTVSSQEEQIASALHDHSRDWPERGLCLPRGKLEWHGLAAQGGMWSGVTGTGVAWEAALFTAGLSPNPVFLTSSQSCSSDSNDIIQRCRQWAVSLKIQGTKSEM